MLKFLKCFEADAAEKEDAFHSRVEKSRVALTCFENITLTDLALNVAVCNDRSEFCRGDRFSFMFLYLIEP